jgi:hypothetical protein
MAAEESEVHDREQTQVQGMPSLEFLDELSKILSSEHLERFIEE